MNTSLPIRPNSEDEFCRMRDEDSPFIRYVVCEACGEPFSEANVHTAAGWRETQISGLCETCFDDMASELTTVCKGEEDVYKGEEDGVGPAF